MVLELAHFRLLLPELHALPAVQPEIDPDALVRLCLSSLHPSRAACAVRPHGLEIERGGRNFHLVERELAALGDDTPVERDERRAVVVQSLAIAALLVGVEVDSSQLSISFDTI